MSDKKKDKKPNEFRSPPPEPPKANPTTNPKLTPLTQQFNPANFLPVQPQYNQPVYNNSKSSEVRDLYLMKRLQGDINHLSEETKQVYMEYFKCGLLHD
jgi:hypothetical protein